jgi:hypothetical protein
MRPIVATVAASVLVIALAAPAVASPPERSSYTSYWGIATYASHLDPNAPGIHTGLRITFSTGQTRTADAKSTFSLVDIYATGYEVDPTGEVNHSWEAGYGVRVTPADPSLGGVDPSLASAWAQSGLLTFVCYQGPCPSMPAQITMSARWDAVGAQTVTTGHPVDDIGGVSTLVNRTRPATVSFEFTGGSLDFPSIETGVDITWQTQVYRAPSH